LGLTPNALTLTSADKVSTIVLTRGSCSADGALRRCSPATVTLLQYGTGHPINIVSATIYLNLTKQDHKLSSSRHLPPKGMWLTLVTTKGTRVSADGVIDTEVLQ